MTTTALQPRHLVLASASPRRRELLAILGVEFSVAPADIDESVLPGEDPVDYVRRMALGKARAGLAAAGAGAVVLGADTAVVLDSHILGKPTGRDDALTMLAALAGREHRVLSAVALVAAGRAAEALSTTRVRFRAITAAEAAAYWATGEPADKAGGYGIQGRGSLFVEEIDGSYSGVVGLPLFETGGLLTQFGFNLLESVRD